MYYSENEMYNLWSKMTDREDDRIEAMRGIFALTERDAIRLDEKFTERRNKRIWENSHPEECARVRL